MKKPRANTADEPDDLRAGIEDVLRSILDDWRADPKLFSVSDKLKIVQYGGMYLTRRFGWIGKEDEPDTTGSAVRKYSGAFRTNVARRGAATPRLAAITVDNDPDDPDDAA